LKSIQRRLSIGLISVMVLVCVVLAQTSLWLFELGLQRYLEAGLRNESESLLVALVRGQNGVQLDEHLQVELSWDVYSKCIGINIFYGA